MKATDQIAQSLFSSYTIHPSDPQTDYPSYNSDAQKAERETEEEADRFNHSSSLETVYESDNDYDDNTDDYSYSDDSMSAEVD